MEANHTVTESFWDVGQYKRTVQRVEDGAGLCEDLAKCLAERASIAKAHSKMLMSFSKKWDVHLNKSAEYGTMREGWRGIMAQADGEAAVFMDVHDRLMSGVESNVLTWKAENYHRAMALASYKEKKRAEEGFEKVQKPWAKLKAKVDKYRKQYHACMRKQELAEAAVAEAQTNPDMKTEKVASLETTAKKAKKDAADARTKYKHGLQKIDDYNDTYRAEMMEEFGKWQEFAAQRIDYIRDQLLEAQRIIDVASRPGLADTCVTLASAFNSINSSIDLASFAREHGTDMEMKWPVFEEYDGDVSVDQVDAPERTMTSQSSSSSVPVPAPRSHDDSQPDHPEEEDDWDDRNAYDNSGSSAILQRAMYDYDAQDPEELSFRAGDIITLISPEDSQGWCEGELNGRRGIYPATYAADRV